MKIFNGNRWVHILAALLLFILGCGKMDETYRPYLKGGEARYAIQPDTILVRSGHNRLELSWQLIAAPRIVKCIVFWNNSLDSVEIPVDQSFKKDTLEIKAIIDDLPEGSYTFAVYTYDADGNRSIAKEATGYVYGSQYLANLSNRLVKSAEKYNNRSKITWYAPHEDAVGVDIAYVDGTGAVQHFISSAKDYVTYLEARPPGDTLRYRTLYKPDSTNIDTFYTSYQTLILSDPVPIELDKSLFTEYPLTSDAPQYNSTANPMSNLWDGKKESWFRTANGSGQPHWYSFDLGITTQLTSYTAWQRGAFVESEYWLLYDNSDPVKWEVWGSNDPAADGSWEGWELLLECESTKPSGLPRGQRSDEDVKAARSGEHFNFSPDVPAVRYIRIKILQTWDTSSSDHSFFGELTFWGINE